MVRLHTLTKQWYISKVVSKHYENKFSIPESVPAGFPPNYMPSPVKSPPRSSPKQPAMIPHSKSSKTISTNFLSFAPINSINDDRSTSTYISYSYSNQSISNSSTTIPPSLTPNNISTATTDSPLSSNIVPDSSWGPDTSFRSEYQHQIREIPNYQIKSKKRKAPRISFSSSTIPSSSSYELRILSQNVQGFKDDAKLDQTIALMKNHRIDIFLA